MVMFLFWKNNTLMYGHIYPTINQGNTCRYLDGSFSPDVISLVFTYDSGKFTIVDALKYAEGIRTSRNAAGASDFSTSTDGISSNHILMLLNE